MFVEVIESEEALRSLTPEWEALWHNDPAADVFTSVDWFLNWWEHFGHKGLAAARVLNGRGGSIPIRGEGARLHVLVVRDQKTPVALVPLIAFQGWWRCCPVRILASPLNNHSPRSGILFSSSPEAAIAALIDHLSGNSQWDILFLNGIPCRDGRGTLLREAVARRGHRLISAAPAWPHSSLAFEGTRAEYFERKGRHFRKHVRQSARNLEELGTVSVDRFCDPGGVATGLRAFMEIDQESWKASGGESVAEHSSLRAYYSDLVERFARGGNCEIWVLRIGGEPAAAYLCLRVRRMLYTLKASCKEKFMSAHYSPSGVLMAHVVEGSWRNNLAGIDFVGRLPFLDRWATEVREFEGVVVFRNAVYPTLGWLLDRTTTRAGLAKRWITARFKRSSVEAGSGVD